MIKNGISAYRNGLKTVPPLVSVVLLYDGILTRIARATAAAASGDTRGQLEHVLQAVQILNGLNQSLDMAAGGRVAVSLRDMYGAVAVALYNSVGSSAAVEASEKIAAALRKTRDAWAHVAGVDRLAAVSVSTVSPSSTILNREQELLRQRTSKKSAVHDIPPVNEHPDPKPGSVPGNARPVRGRLGSMA
jgi:flagellar protein FliS